MLTKTQKKEQVQLATEQIKKSKAIVFADFSGITDAQMKTLKKELRAQGAEVKVFKKRLLNVALQEAGIQFDPLQQERLLASIFSKEEMTELAGVLAKFSKQFQDTEGSHFEIIDAYDAQRAALIGKEEFMVIASLPSREVLLAMIMGGFSSPLRAFMSIVKQLSQKAPPVEEKKAETPAETEVNEEKVAETKEEESK